jgi:hypothetical protein
MGAAAVLLAGCVVTSVCPFYTAKDVVFEPALVGDWIAETNSAGNEIWKFDAAGDQAYRFTIIKPDTASVMEAHAFKLDGQLFLDVSSLNTDISVIPPHYLLKINQTEPTLRMSQLDHDWLKGLLAKKPGAIRHHLIKDGDKPDDVRVVLTADTPELQKFVLANLKTEGAWADIELHREARVAQPAKE